MFIISSFILIDFYRRIPIRNNFCTKSEKKRPDDDVQRARSNHLDISTSARARESKNRLQSCRVRRLVNKKSPFLSFLTVSALQSLIRTKNEHTRIIYNNSGTRVGQHEFLLRYARLKCTTIRKQPQQQQQQKLDYVRAMMMKRFTTSWRRDFIHDDKRKIIIIIYALCILRWSSPVRPICRFRLRA